MKALDVFWTMAPCNKLKIICDCGKEFDARIDRWYCFCPECGRKGSIEELRMSLIRGGKV